MQYKKFYINTPQRAYNFLIAYAVLSSIYSYFFKQPGNYNNYVIFKSSFFHLLDGLSLYDAYPLEHHDYYKYSPTFAFLFGVFAYLPLLAGLCLWNFVGTLLLCIGIHQTPLTDKQKVAAFWVFLPAFIGSVMNFQSNIHIVACMLINWQALERKQYWIAALCLVAGFYMKIFALFSSIMIIFYLKEWRFVAKYISALTLLMVAGFLAPLLATSWPQLLFQYHKWGALLKLDSSITYGYSVMSMVHLIFNVDFKNEIIQLPAAVAWIVVFFICRNTDYRGRLLAFCSLCFFCVLFNHRTESSTFVIAMVGLGFYQNFIENQKWRWFIICIGLLGVNFFHSSLFTTNFKHTINAYSFKIWPFLIIWPALTYDFISRRLYRNESLAPVDPVPRR